MQCIQPNATNRNRWWCVVVNRCQWYIRAIAYTLTRCHTGNAGNSKYAHHFATNSEIITAQMIERYKQRSIVFNLISICVMCCRYVRPDRPDWHGLLFSWLYYAQWHNHVSDEWDATVRPYQRICVHFTLDLLKLMKVFSSGRLFHLVIVAIIIIGSTHAYSVGVSERFCTTQQTLHWS